MSFWDKLFGAKTTVEPPRESINTYTPMEDYSNNPLEVSKIKIEKTFTMCCVTWNMHGLCPTQKDVNILLEPHKGYDIIAIGTEECLRSIFISLFYDNKGQWEIMLKRCLGKEYEIVSSKTLSSIHLIVFIKKEYHSVISKIGTNVVKAGISNILGNKGGVGIWFSLYNMSILIINAHLASGKKQTERRNSDFTHIISNMTDKIDITNFVIFMGDLNYRINKEVNEIREKITKSNDYLQFLEFDQLHSEKSQGRLKAVGFQEGIITFNPTYKFADGSSEYKIDSDNHVPSWTDRIIYLKQLFVSNAIFDASLFEYNSQTDVLMSDHKPVYAYFKISVQVPME